MKMFKRVFAGIALAAALATSAQASVTVQGITWDPGFVLGKFDFRQQLVTTGNVTELKGLGEFYYFGNTGPTSPSVDPISSTGGGLGTFAAGRELTFTFGGFIANAGQFSGGSLTVYSDNHNDYSQGTTNTNYSLASNSDYAIPFLQLTAVSSNFAADPGSIGFQSGVLAVIWNVTGGAAAGFFDTNAFASPFGSIDITSRASATFPDSAGSFSNTGANGQINAFSVPEPASLALIGLGLLGVVASRRRKNV